MTLRTIMRWTTKQSVALQKLDASPAPLDCPNVDDLGPYEWIILQDYARSQSNVYTVSHENLRDPRGSSTETLNTYEKIRSQYMLQISSRD